MSQSAVQMESDPVLSAAFGAPVVEASLEEHSAFEEGLASLQAGGIIRAEHVRERLMSRSED